MRTAGRHFLQIPGPSNVPDPVLRAMARPTIDHRGPEFAEITGRILENLKPVFQTDGPVLLFPSSGTGAWEAALVNTLNPGDRVLAFEIGHFSSLWGIVAVRLGLNVDWLEGDWRRGVDLAAAEAELAADTEHTIKAVMVVHSETSTGALSDVAGMRAVLDRTGHPALLLVDTISSLASVTCTWRSRSRR